MPSPGLTTPPGSAAQPHRGTTMRGEPLDELIGFAIETIGADATARFVTCSGAFVRQGDDAGGQHDVGDLLHLADQVAGRSILGGIASFDDPVRLASAPVPGGAAGVAARFTLPSAR